MLFYVQILTLYNLVVHANCSSGHFWPKNESVHKIFTNFVSIPGKSLSSSQSQYLGKCEKNLIWCIWRVNCISNQLSLLSARNNIGLLLSSYHETMFNFTSSEKANDFSVLIGILPKSKSWVFNADWLTEISLLNLILLYR